MLFCITNTQKRPIGKGQTPHYIAPTTVVRREAGVFGGVLPFLSTWLPFLNKSLAGRKTWRNKTNFTEKYLSKKQIVREGFCHE